MEIKYQSYWASVKKLQTEAQLIGRLDLSNKTKYKNKYETGTMTAEDIARANHINGLHYELTLLKENQLLLPGLKRRTHKGKFHRQVTAGYSPRYIVPHHL